MINRATVTYCSVKVYTRLKKIPKLSIFSEQTTIYTNLYFGYIMLSKFNPSEIPLSKSNSLHAIAAYTLNFLAHYEKTPPIAFFIFAAALRRAVAASKRHMASVRPWSFPSD